MRQALPWTISALLLIGLIATFSELQRMRTRFGEVTAHQFHDHADVREFMIRAALDGTRDPIVILGDSITEMAPLPREICGHRVINAGIGGQTIKEATRLAARVFSERGAYLIAITVGANDSVSSTANADFGRLIETVKPLSARPIVAAAVSPNDQTNHAISVAAANHGVKFVAPDIPLRSRMRDGIHFSNDAYQIWTPALIAEISKQCG